MNGKGGLWQLMGYWWWGKEISSFLIFIKNYTLCQ